MPRSFELGLIMNMAPFPTSEARQIERLIPFHTTMLLIRSLALGKRSEDSVFLGKEGEEGSHLSTTTNHHKKTKERKRVRRTEDVSRTLAEAEIRSMSAPRVATLVRNGYRRASESHLKRFHDRGLVVKNQSQSKPGRSA